MKLPLHRMATEKQWTDLVLDDSVLRQIDRLRSWRREQRSISPVRGQRPAGHTALFYGPAGAGKSLAAALLAKEFGAELYQIDLSAVVSKYIGETEKNLDRIFETAARKDWILFFDEADALFGKRSEVKDSHDRYADLEVDSLMQRIEDYSGLVILATNLRSNLDPAFLRRFRSAIHFPGPEPEERNKE